MILTPQQLISKTIDKLEQSGWTQGQLRKTKRGPYCAFGAMYFSIPQTVHITENYAILGLVMEKIEDKVDKHIIDWNDTKGRTYKDVILLLQEVLISYGV